MQEAGQRRVVPGLMLAALWALGVVLYAVLGQRHVIPSISPDEFTYGHLARSVADGDGLTWNGESVPFRAALYIYAIAPAWLVSSTTSAYAIAKVVGVALCATVVVPTWLLARRAVGPSLALVPAGLSLAGTWMLVSAGVLTENLAYPAGVAALAAIVMTVQRPGSRWLWIALGLIALAALSRAQLAVLIAVVPLAALADAARGGMRAAIGRHRRTIIAGAVLTAAGVIAAVAAPSTLLGAYAGVDDYSPSLGALLTSAGRHAIGLAAMAGLLPAVLVVTLTVLRAAWADEELGPMLAVFWAAALILIAQVAWYMAGTDRDWHIERYLMYLVPLALTIAIAGIARVRPGWQPIVLVTLALAVLMLLAAPMRNVSEEEGVFGVFRPLHGLLGASTPVSLALATLLVGFVAAGFAHRAARDGGGSGGALAATLAAVTLGVLVVQDAAAWTWRIDAVRDVRADRPADLRWLDHAAGGRIGRIVAATNTLRSQHTEFYNRDVTQVYVPAPQIGVVGGPLVRGRTCTWSAAADGRLALGRGCGPVPSRFLLDDEVAKLTFAGQRLVANEPKGGRIVDVGRRPRLLALVFLPCGPKQFRITIGDDGVPRRLGRIADCTAEIRGNLWLDRPGRLQLRFRGGETDQRIAAGGRVTLIPAGGTATVDVAAPGSPTAFQFQQDWTGTGPQYPTLEAFDLVRGTERVDLMGVARD